MWLCSCVTAARWCFGWLLVAGLMQAMVVVVAFVFGENAVGMRRVHDQGVTRGSPQPRTTIPAKDGIRAGDQLNRDFTAAAPDRVWVADFTYVPTGPGGRMWRS